MIVVKLLLISPFSHWIGDIEQIKKFKHEDDILTYIDNFNTKCKIGSATIKDFKILN